MIETPPLREALIDAGIALLDEGGMAALTLRRAAARAGVSHAAPAHHFDGLPGLLTAIATRAFQIFSDTMDDACNAAGSDPMAKLQGLCDGYLTFARSHHGLFHVMFVSPQVNRDDPALTPHSARAYLLLRAACLPFAAPGATRDVELETAVWSMVHGYASLNFNHETAKRRSYVTAPDFAILLQELLSGRQNSAAIPLAPRRELG